MAKPKFLRRDWHKKSKLGRKRKKKQVWRKPKGRHTKTRLKKRGYLKQPSIGYSKKREERGKIAGLKPILIHNVKELNAVKKDNAAFIASGVGMLKKAAIAKKAIETGIKLANLDTEKFLEEIAKKKEEKKAEEKVKKKEEEKKEKGKEKKAEKEKEEETEKEKKEKEEAEKEEEKEEEKEKKEKEKILHKEIPKVRPEVVKAKKAVKVPLRRVALEK